MEVLAYRAFSARKLADMTGKKKDATFATTLENELLTALCKASGLGMDRLPVPTPDTQEGNSKYEAWVATLEDRF